jgi:2-polyprenyl-6-methoxyphenol hydroxylase-like FAD-dependent oxidoreductase
VAAVKNAPEQPMPTQGWEHTARLEDVLAPFTSFVFDFLDVPALMRGAATIYQYPMADRDPLPTWHFGRVTLLGDAAHPMYPSGSNGASQAIIDTRVLARELALQPSIEAAIAAYDAQGRPQTAGMVRANRQSGPERCIGIVEQRAGRVCGSRRGDQPRRARSDCAELQAHSRLRPGDPQHPAVAGGGTAPRRRAPTRGSPRPHARSCP